MRVCICLCYSLSHSHPLLPSTVSTSLFSRSVSIFLLCKQVHQIIALCFFFFSVSFPHFLAVSYPSKQLACEASSGGVPWVILAKMEAQAEYGPQTSWVGGGFRASLQLPSFQDILPLGSRNSSFSWWDRMGMTSSRQLLLSATYENPLLLFSMEKLLWVY